jgi:hypothetical protein
MNDEVKEDEMGITCSTYGGEEKSMYNSGWKASWKEIIRKMEM